MRILIRTTKNNNIIPFNYQGLLAGTLHKWLEYNEIHNKMSLYSFSWLSGTSINRQGFNCPNGATWFISFYDNTYVKKIIKSIMSSPDMFCGLRVTDVIIKETPIFSEMKCFKLASPILLKEKKDNDNIIHITYKDDNVDELLEKSIRHKMKMANIPEDDSLKITIDKNSSECKTKFVKIHNIGNRCFLCPIKIEGSDITKEFIWNVGLGNSTGVGFGSLY